MSINVLAQVDRRAGHNRAHLQARLRDLRLRIGPIVTSNYDVSDVCNLTCEGCLYFSGLNYAPRLTVSSVDQWRNFFASEADRGVTFGYFAGAEPSLVPDVLRAAMPYIRSGVVATNGIKRIPEDIQYRIHISLWGDEADNKAMRGADNGRKALSNYRGDERATAVYTINRRNISQIVPVTALCAEHRIPITFSYFSPTDDYLARLSGQTGQQSDYFRVSTAGDDLRLQPDDFARAHDTIAEAMRHAPGHVLYSLEYDHWVTQPGGLYTLDPIGVAMDCGNRLARYHQHYSADMTKHQGKCCSPNIDCSGCRAYLQGYATLLSRLRQFSKTDDDLAMWLDTWELWAKIFLSPRGG